MWYAMLINCFGAHQDTYHSFRWAEYWLNSQSVSSFLQNFGTCACNTAFNSKSRMMWERRELNRDHRQCVLGFTYNQQERQPGTRMMSTQKDESYVYVYSIRSKLVNDSAPPHAFTRERVIKRSVETQQNDPILCLD